MDVQLFVRKLWVLSYVPVKDVLLVYEGHILPSMPEYHISEDEEDALESTDNFNKPLESFVDFFESTWLGAVNKWTKVTGN